MGTLFNSQKPKSSFTGKGFMLSVATVLGTVLGLASLAAGGALVVAAMVVLSFAFSSTIYGSLLWLANYALVKAFAIKMLTFKQDLCIGAAVTLVKTILTPGQKS